MHTYIIHTYIHTQDTHKTHTHTYTGFDIICTYHGYDPSHYNHRKHDTCICICLLTSMHMHTNLICLIGIDRECTNDTRITVFMLQALHPIRPRRRKNFSLKARE